jgi:uncharacterized membrane protein (UPF0127 family)
MSVACVPSAARTARTHRRFVANLVLLASRVALVALLVPLLVHCRGGVSSEAQAAPPKAPSSAPANLSPAAAAAAPAQHVVMLEPVGFDAVRVRVEVVQTPQERQRGLMYRKQLDPDAGMLFVFERPQHNVFWMHNTLLPLDMIFITPSWSVLGVVENATPQTDSPREVPGESLYVLEVNAGFARQHGITRGTKVQWIKTGAARQGT